jgi:hypothetical protein
VSGIKHKPWCVIGRDNTSFENYEFNIQEKNMKRSQAGFVIIGMGYFLLTSVLIAGIITVDQHTSKTDSNEIITPAAARELPNADRNGERNEDS